MPGGGFAAVARLGAELRAARERLGWHLPAVSGYLRIRLDYLDAIENGRMGDLPAGAYAIGFVRAYGQVLGLDGDDVARRFRAEAAEMTRTPDLRFPVPAPQRGVPVGAVLLLGAVVAAGAYVGWYQMSGSDRRGGDPVAPVPARLAPLAERAMGDPGQVPPRAAVATAAPPGLASAVAPAQQPMQLPVVPPSSAAAAIPSTGLAGGVYSPAPAAQTALLAPPVTASPAPPDASRPPSVLGDAARSDGSRSDQTRVIVRARAEAWVQVRERQGKVLLNRVMRPGEAWPVPSRGNALLTTGNAGGTEIVVDGIATASLGADGAVRRDLSLDPDALKAAQQVAATPPVAPVVAGSAPPAPVSGAAKAKPPAITRP